MTNENVLGFPSLVLFFFLFPNGHFVPSWTRWVATGFAVLSVCSALLPNTFFNLSNGPGLLYLPLSLAVFGSLVFAQIYRYRRISTPTERQQTKWVVFGVAVALLGFLLLGVLLPRFLGLFIPLQNVGLLPSMILIASIYLLLLLIPLSLAIAILHYRLWDVDVLINKTLVYGLLTGTLVVVYVGCILGLQTLLRGLFNQTLDIAIIASTLVIAALFQPLRQRIQAGIDRRFFRRKYDAAHALTAFNAALRSEVDLQQVSDLLTAVIQETMQPAHVWLWLRNPVSPQGRNTRMLPKLNEEEDL